MNKEIKFGAPGGFPLTQDTLGFMQQQVQLIANGIGKSISVKENNDYLILDGCQKQNNSISPGIVSVKGEILPFAGGVVQNDVLLVETKQNVVFADGKIHDIYITRALRFGAGAGVIPWSLFKRIVPAYDYIVDSDEKFGGLHNNPYATNVLVKRGIWKTTDRIGLHEETRNIVGEDGAVLQFTGAGALRWPHGFEPSNITCVLEGLQLRFIAANGESRGIEGFSEVSNCHIHIDSTNDGEDNQTPLIRYCTNIIGCTIRHIGNQHKDLMADCERVANSSFAGSGNISLFAGNRQIYNCRFDNLRYKHNIGTTTCWFHNSAIEDCQKVNNCHYTGAAASPYVRCYASYDENAQYTCADTPVGGFNSKSNI